MKETKTTHQKENQKVPRQVDDRSLLKNYEEFRKLYTDLDDSTLAKYKRHLVRLFDWLDLEGSAEWLNRIDFEVIQKFVTTYQENHGGGSRKSMHSALRSFLAFCHIEGHLPKDLSAAVPSVRKRKLAHVPLILDDESYGKLFESIDRSSPAGMRDYAILMLIATYGVRGCQVRQLQLEDLFWRQGRILFQPAKKGTAVEQPLVSEVSNSLHDYLLNARPKSNDYREVFLTNQRPYRPLAHSSALSAMIARRLKRAKIQVPDNALKGSHLFRHTFASRQLASGTPLAQIGEMLGHRNQNSTLIYTKIDFKSLMNVAQEWPVVLS